MGKVTGIWCVVIISVSLLLPGSLGIQAQEQKPSQITINYAEASLVADKGLNGVQAYVTVLDTDGRPMLGLQKEDFVVAQNSVPVELLEARLADDPIAVILLIDTSNSMKAADKTGRPAIDSAKEAAVRFIEALGEQDQVAVYTFDAKPNLVQDLTLDHGAAINGVSVIEATPWRTCLYDAAWEAVTKSAEVPQGRRAVVLFTDGRDERVMEDGSTDKCSTFTFNDVIDTATLKRSKVPIYTIGLASGNIDEQELIRLARRTKGRNFIVNEPEELPGTFRLLANEMHSQYQLRYETDAPSGDQTMSVKLNRLNSPIDERSIYLLLIPPPPPPDVWFISPDDKTSVRPEDLERGIPIELGVDPVDRVLKTRFYVDGIVIQESTEPPFTEFFWDTADLKPGKHMMRAEVIDKYEHIIPLELMLTVPTPPTPTPTWTPTPPPTHTPTPLPPTKTPTRRPTPTPPPPLGGGCLIAGVFGLVLLGGIALIIIGLIRRRRSSEEVSWGTGGTGGTSGLPSDIFDSADGSEDESVADHTSFGDDDGDLTGDIEDGEMTTDLGPEADLIVERSVNLPRDTRFRVSGRRTAIGRNTARFQDNDIDISDEPVSRRQAEIEYEAGTYRIKDLHSRYGTKVDGQAVPPDDSLPLRNGMRVQLGTKTVLRFEMEGESETPDLGSELDSELR